MSSNSRNEDRKNSQGKHLQGSGKRTSDGKSNPTPAKVRKNKTLVTICGLTASVYFMVLVLCYGTRYCLAQNVVFSNERISFHAERHVISQRLINAEILKTIQMIETATKSTDFEDLGAALTDHLNTMLKDYQNDYNALFNIYDKPTREGRGFRFLGNLASELFETVSPDQWTHQQQVDKQLLSIADKQNTNIKTNRKAIKHINSKMDNAIKILQSQTLYIQNMTNEIELSENNTMTLSHAIILHTRANDLLSHAIRDNHILQSILDKSELDLPSRFMFPMTVIKKTIRENFQNDKIHSSLFFSDNELNLIYNFESARTVYDPKTNKVHSFLYLPLTDFSNKLSTKKLSNLDLVDKNRIHKIESISKKSISRILCTDRFKALRLLSMDNLKSCQSHRTKSLYLCSGREIFINFDQLYDCDSIKKLPPTLVFELDQSHILIDRKEKEEIKFFCNNVLHHTLKAETSTEIILLPKECHILSKTIKVSKIETNSINKNITVNEKFKIFPIKIKPYKPYHKELIKNISIKNENESLFPNEIQEKIDEQIQETKNEIKSFTKSGPSNFNIGSITFSSVTFALMFAVGIVLLIFIRKHLGKSKHSCECEQKIKEITDSVERIREHTVDLEVKFLRNFKKQIDKIDVEIKKADEKMDDMITKTTETQENFLKMTSRLEQNQNPEDLE